MQKLLNEEDKEKKDMLENIDNFVPVNNGQCNLWLVHVDRMSICTNWVCVLSITILDLSV